jgi:hypothetical protein
LIERNIRIGHDGQELPKYISYLKSSICEHPQCKLKYFTRVKDINELYQEALDHLETLKI